MELERHSRSKAVFGKWRQSQADRCPGIAKVPAGGGRPDRSTQEAPTAVKPYTVPQPHVPSPCLSHSDRQTMADGTPRTKAPMIAPVLAALPRTQSESIIPTGTSVSAAISRRAGGAGE